MQVLRLSIPCFKIVPVALRTTGFCWTHQNLFYSSRYWLVKESRTFLRPCDQIRPCSRQMYIVWGNSISLYRRAASKAWCVRIDPLYFSLTNSARVSRRLWNRARKRRAAGRVRTRRSGFCRHTQFVKLPRGTMNRVFSQQIFRCDGIQANVVAFLIPAARHVLPLVICGPTSSCFASFDFVFAHFLAFVEAPPVRVSTLFA